MVIRLMAPPTNNFCWVFKILFNVYFNFRFGKEEGFLQRKKEQTSSFTCSTPSRTSTADEASPATRFATFLRRIGVRHRHFGRWEALARTPRSFKRAILGQKGGVLLTTSRRPSWTPWTYIWRDEI